MNRKIKLKVNGFPATDGAGVKLVRVLGRDTVEEFDPILMLDSFDSENPSDYTKGFPFHPHRGIETISYVYNGKMTHRDSLGNEDTIGDGEVQWMTAGSGILHEEKLPESERLLGVQLWLNLPAKDKMTNPQYLSIKNDEIKDIEIDGGKLRLLAGSYNKEKGYKSKYLPLDYYDIHLNNGKLFKMETKEDDSIMLFTLKGKIEVEGELVEEKTAVKLTNGNSISFSAKDGDAQVLYVSSRRLDEPVFWGGPIVMASERDLYQAFMDLENDEFLQSDVSY